MRILIKKVNLSKEIIDFLKIGKNEYIFKSSDVGCDISRRTSGIAIQLSALIAGLLGFILAFFFQYWSAKYYYPLISSNRGTAEIISYIPVSFEIAILLAGIASFVTFIAISNSRNNLTNPDSYEFIEITAEKNDSLNIIEFLNKNNISFDQNEE